MTFHDAERAWLDDRATDQEFEAYCYAWRNLSRFSTLGKAPAARHAKRNKLPLPRSDRHPES